MKLPFPSHNPVHHAANLALLVLLPPLLLALCLLTGCGAGAAAKPNQPFFTSGSRQADQRASQRMAKSEQLTGSGEGSGENGPVNSGAPGSQQPVQAQKKRTLYDRLGGEAGITAIVTDFIPRAMHDPRVNWSRKGVESGGWFHHKPSVTWNATATNVARLKLHFVQFIALASGGPAQYQGKGMKAVHAGMQISNAEFDAVVGDLKASLDKLQIANEEQKELLAIIESTRPEIVEKR